MKLKTLKSGLQTMPRAQPVEINPDSWRTDKRTSSQRGYGYKWQQARAAYLAKHPFCVMCLSAAGIDDGDLEDVASKSMRAGIGLPWATVVDHKVPHRGDMVEFWKSEGWQPLCATHHSSDKQRAESGM